MLKTPRIVCVWIADIPRDRSAALQPVCLPSRFLDRDETERTTSCTQDGHSP